MVAVPTAAIEMEKVVCVRLTIFVAI